MPNTVHSLFQDKFVNADDVIKCLSEFENKCLETGDLRGVFATAYLHITRNINTAIQNREFRDNEWSVAYLVRFANLYREAVLNYETALLTRIPKSWILSFDLAKEKEGLIIQHLLLGINAHINHDLSIALFDVSIDPHRKNKYHDHNLVNHILEKATETLKKEVSRKYAPVLSRLDRKTGHISDDVTSFSIPKARDHAWSFAVALTLAKRESEQTMIRKVIDDQAAVLARLILASPTRDHRFTRSVSFLKSLDKRLTGFKYLFRKN